MKTKNYNMKWYYLIFINHKLINTNVINCYFNFFFFFMFYEIKVAIFINDHLLTL
jgi:hypothetical protein